jgi:rhamnose transport system permease protein
MEYSTLKAARRKKRMDITALRLLSMVIFIFLLMIFVVLRNPHFLGSANLRDVFMDTAILGLAAIAQLIVMLTGNIDVSSSSVIAVAGFSSALLMKNNPTISPLFSLLLAMILGLTMGAFNGLVVGYGNVPSIIVTLGTLSAYRGVNFIISGGGWVVSRDLPDTFRLISNGKFLSLPYLIYFCIAAALFFYYMVNHLKWGRYLYSIGSSLEHAVILGIDYKKIIFFVFMIAGTLYGLCGVLWVSRYNFAQSNTASGFELTVIAACVIGGVSVTGGRGTVEGAILGAFLLSFIINAINIIKISPFWKMAIQGVIILTAVILDSYLTSRRKR